MNTEQKKQLYTLLSALREDVITDEQFSELDAMVSTDREAGKEYVRYIKLWTDLQFFQMASQESDTEPFADPHVWEALAESERTAPALQIQKVEEKPKELIRKIERSKAHHKIKKSSLMSIIVSAAALLFIVLFARFAPPKSGAPVVTLVDSINAKWANPDVSMKEGVRLVTGSTHSLLGGGGLPNCCLTTMRW